MILWEWKRPECAALKDSEGWDMTEHTRSGNIEREKQGKNTAQAVQEQTDPHVRAWKAVLPGKDTLVQEEQPVVISLRDVKKTYVIGETTVHALRGVSLEVHQNEFVAIMGPSGSGKSTLMNIIGCLDRPSSGSYTLAGQLVSEMSRAELARVRNTHLGFVFQSFNLLPRATALRNVEVPLVYAGVPREKREVRARQMLDVVGLGERVHHRPTQLSGGQQQRVAIARALVNHPSLLLADEPTGNLDSRMSKEIMETLEALHRQGLTILLVTHDPGVADHAQRQVELYDGRVIRDESRMTS
jgi:putative ABC transport system ATP-binding protein